jgi:hypothetical protein
MKKENVMTENNSGENSFDFLTEFDTENVSRLPSRRAPVEAQVSDYLSEKSPRRDEDEDLLLQEMEDNIGASDDGIPISSDDTKPEEDSAFDSPADVVVTKRESVPTNNNVSQFRPDSLILTRFVKGHWMLAAMLSIGLLGIVGYVLWPSFSSDSQQKFPKPENIIAAPRVDLKMTVASSSSFGPAGAQKSIENTSMSEAITTAKNNSTAIVLFQNQLLSLQRSIGAIQAAPVAEQQSPEVTYAISNLSTDIRNLRSSVVKMQRQVDRNEKDIGTIRTKSAVRETEKPRSDISKTAIAKISKSNHEKIKPVSGPKNPSKEITTINDYVLVVISARGAMVKQVSNPSNKFFLFAGDYYEKFGRVLKTDTVNKTISGIDGNGNQWVIKKSRS